jgi:hypothetical protein
MHSSDGYGGSNDNHPLTNGTYNDSDPPVCSICNKPISQAEDRKLTGEFSYGHKGCIDAARVEFQYLKVDGTPVPRGHCVMPDHRETTVSVTIRSNNALSLDRVKDILQREFEVTKITITGGTIFVK